jgi:N-acetylglucosaminyldiphosphoundecaprenol N-acetyl-beta-D-mannosaminyltransferase
MKQLSQIQKWSLKINSLTISEFVNIIEQNIINRTTLIQQTSVNAYTIVCIQNDNDLREIINKSSLVNIDGMSVVWALTFLGYKNITKASCPDIFDRLIELSSEKGYKPFFLGATAEIIESAMINLQSKYPTLQIAGYHHGYFSDEESEKIAEIIRDSKADMLFLGISSPKKELFSNKYSEYMQIPYTFGVGGVFDIIAGVTKRAPMWMQKSGLEWFYRFIQEPRRMWRRYLIGNIKFIWIVMKEKFKK